MKHRIERLSIMARTILHYAAILAFHFHPQLLAVIAERLSSNKNTHDDNEDISAPFAIAALDVDSILTVATKENLLEKLLTEVIHFCMTPLSIHYWTESHPTEPNRPCI